VVGDGAGGRRGGAERIKLLGPLRIRDFRLLWTGMAASLFGDGIFLVALAWQVYELSNSPAALAVVGVAATVPMVLCLLVGGVVSDRMDRRRVMMSADAARGVAVAVMGALSLAGRLELWHIVVVAALYGAANAFFGPSFDAIVPELVPAGLLAEANSLDQLVRPAVLRLAGPAVGGLVIAAAGPGGAFLLDAATFGVSALCIVLMRPRAAVPAPDRAGTPLSTLGEIREGYRFVRTRVWLWGTFAAAAIAYLLFMGPTEVLLPLVVKRDMGGSAAVLGVVFAMGGLGAILGALVVGQRGIPRRHVTFMFLAWAMATFAVAGYGLARLPWQAMVASFVFNILETVGTIVWATTKHRLVPGALLGRVSSFDWLISIGLVPISFAITAPVAAALGARATLVWAGALGGVVTLAGLFLPGMRDVERKGLLFRLQDDDPGSQEAGPSAPQGLLPTLTAP
jgi:DHA3 family tetracycline resistance protein-like MFS transporter